MIRVKALVSVLCLAGAFVTAAPAVHAAGTGSIEGRVLGPDGSPVPAMRVAALVRVGTPQVDYAAVTESDEDGRFVLPELEAGTYRVEIDDRRDVDDLAGYPVQYYPASPDAETAGSVVVQAGRATPDIEMHLVPGGSIAGSMTSETGDPLAGYVEAVRLPGGQAIGGTAFVEDDGSFRIGRLYPGSYRVGFTAVADEESSQAEYTPRWWRDSPTAAGATAVDVTSGVETDRIHQAMDPVDDPSNLAVVWPPADKRRARHGSFVVTGRIDGGARPVRLEYQGTLGWTTYVTSRSTTDGRISIPVPVTWYGRHVLRVVAPTVATYLPAVSARRGVLDVVPDYTPRGGSGYRTHGVVPWTVCDAPITYAFNPASAPSRVLDDVKEAVRRLAAATGYTFRYVGTTRARPFAYDAYPARADVVIGYERGAYGTEDALGFGGFRTSSGDRTRGAVMLSRSADTRNKLRSGFGKGATRGQVLMHELGHVMGLDHVVDERLVMDAQLSLTRTARYATGDLRGLAKLGAGRGCAPDPDSRQAAPHSFRTS